MKEDPNTCRQWRFTWETLAHIPTLRLYLFNPDIGDISAACRSLEAELRLGESLLIVSLKLDGEINGSCGTSVLRVPVPRVLIDPDSPVDVNVMGDYIEAKLILLLPVEHPVASVLLGAPDLDGDRGLPLSLDSDIEKFSSEGVNFFCKSCSTKLTRQPLRNFVEVPSTNWQDVADNWFGGCCSFGGVSEKLVSKYMNTFDCKVGTCLLDRASVSVCERDLEGAILEKTHSDSARGSPNLNDTGSSSCDFSLDHNYTSSTCLVSSQSNSDTGPQEIFSSSNVCNTEFSLVETQLNINMDCLKLDFIHSSEDHEKTELNYTGGRTSNCDFHFCITETARAAAADVKSESEASTTYNTQQSTKVYGSCFMITPANLSKGVECVELSCTHCSSPLGSYPRAQGTTSPIDVGIRLFKCYISTSLSVDNDAFKKYTLQNIFTNLLIEGAQDELSFRTVVCDLRTKSPILQIVLLNSRAWCCSGDCFENTVTRGLPAMHMKPVVKVLFSDHHPSTEINSIAIREWPTRTGSAEEVYMMARQIEELRRSLKSSIAMLPPSCSFLQGMSLSFLERLNWRS